MTSRVFTSTREISRSNTRRHRVLCSTMTTHLACKLLAPDLRPKCRKRTKTEPISAWSVRFGTIENHNGHDTVVRSNWLDANRIRTPTRKTEHKRVPGARWQCWFLPSTFAFNVDFRQQVKRHEIHFWLSPYWCIVYVYYTHCIPLSSTHFTALKIV